jgi:uncharacterized protein YbaR (Trm112 family)
VCYEIRVLPESLVEILVCPRSKQPLVYFPRGEADRHEADAFLLCPASGLRYPVRDGVPVMLVDEALDVSPSALEVLLVRARELGLAERRPEPRTSTR